MSPPLSYGQRAARTRVLAARASALTTAIRVRDSAVRLDRAIGRLNESDPRVGRRTVRRA